MISIMFVSMHQTVTMQRLTIVGNTREDSVNTRTQCPSIHNGFSIFHITICSCMHCCNSMYTTKGVSSRQRRLDTPLTPLKSCLFLPFLYCLYLHFQRFLELQNHLTYETVRWETLKHVVDQIDCSMFLILHLHLSNRGTSSQFNRDPSLVD